MALADALRTFMYVSLWGKPVLSVARGLSGLIKSMFKSGEQGFAYDINDLSTLFQDAAGTIPVTAAGQPVGLVLDKSKGLVLGGELITNGTFESQASWTLTAGFTIANGYLTSNATSNSSATTTLTTPLIVGSIIEVSYNLTSFTSGNPRFYLGGGDNKYIPTTVGRNKFRMLVTAQSTTVSWYSGYVGTGGTWSIDDFSIKVVQGNHAYQTTSASRPLLQRNATTGAYYLAFDGTDDFLVTNSIDFTTTDKISLFAGVRKLSDAATNVIAEFSSDFNTYNGAFNLINTGAGYFQAGSKGTSASYIQSAINPQPFSAVISVRTQISVDALGMRMNGFQYPTKTTDQGTGNYGNYPLYIGRRAGSSFPFNGHLYSLIGVGRLSTDVETTNLEKAIAKNVGVTL